MDSYKTDLNFLETSDMCFCSFYLTVSEESWYLGYLSAMWWLIVLMNLSWAKVISRCLPVMLFILILPKFRAFFSKISSRT